MPKLTRDTILFIVGLLGIFHETIIYTGAERPTLLLLFGAFCGLPIVLRWDERDKK